MKKKILIAVGVLVLVVGGIWGFRTYQEIEKGKKERANTTIANVVEPTKTTTPVSAPVASGPMRTFNLTEKSLIRWTGYKKVGQHSGWFILFDGVGKMPDNNLEQATIELSIETDSVETDDPSGILTKVMKNESFFHCAKFPTATFKSVSIVKVETNVPNLYTVTGDLQIRDITKRIAFPATITVAGDTVKLEADFKVNRRWWNIVWQAAGDSFLYDDVRIELKAEAKEKAS